MTNSGTATYANPDEYQAGFGGTSVNLVLTGRGDFKARLTWAQLRYVNLLQVHENLGRIAYVSLAPTRAFISFSLGSDPPPTWSGVKLRSRDIVFHSLGERAHFQTKRASQWGLLSLPPRQLAAYSLALTDMEIHPPPFGRILRAPAAEAAHLRRLHSKACKLAETKPEIIAHPEAARGLEQDLIHTLINCLAAEHACDRRATKQHQDIMVRFEEALKAEKGVSQPSISKLCAAIRVSERTLRSCCAEILGISPSRYIRLRRLQLVRAALSSADPTTTSVAEISRRYHFNELGRFAGYYRTHYGETPSATLRRGKELDVSRSTAKS
jgi:AraC-like DNA-binding protein